MRVISSCVIIPPADDRQNSRAGPSPRARWGAAGVLALYGLFLFVTNPLVTVFEDEASITGAAGRETRELLTPLVSGQVEFHHPPLSDWLLHFWLRLTGGSFPALRIPSILFYCLALWIISETAELLWQKRWTAVIISIAWPAGYFLGRPAGWYALSMLEIAGLAWFYLRWRAKDRSLDLLGFACCAVLLAYTNYFGWIFVGVLGLDLWLARPKRAVLSQFLIATGAAVLLFLPLAAELFRKASSEIHQPSRLLGTLLRAVYLAHSLLASEMAAPWTWPGVVAAGCGATLLCLGARQTQSRRALLWLAIPMAAGLGMGIFSGVRLVLFGPGLLLFLTSLAEVKQSKTAAALIGAAFAMGWVGIATGLYPGTHRYIEPWRMASARALEMSRPGDSIICNHPSFYFYSSYLLPWTAERRTPSAPGQAGGRVFTALNDWRQVVPGSSGRILYVRTTLMRWALGSEKEFLDYASRNLKLTDELRFDKDRSASLKHRWFPDVDQPEWRIRVQVWTKPQ